VAHFTAMQHSARPLWQCGIADDIQFSITRCKLYGMDNAQQSKVRVFFALWPSNEERAALAAWQPPLHKLCGGRTMRTDTLHATLVFLGDVEEHRLEALQLAAQEVAGSAFQLIFDVARYWGHNHILYASASNVPPHLLRLVEDLEQCLIRHRFHFEKRPYKLHLTLLRHARCNDAAPLPTMQRVAWRVRDFVLVQSVPDQNGASYQVLARFSLSKHSRNDASQSGN